MDVDIESMSGRPSMPLGRPERRASVLSLSTIADGPVPGLSVHEFLHNEVGGSNGTREGRKQGAPLNDTTPGLRRESDSDPESASGERPRPASLELGTSERKRPESPFKAPYRRPLEDAEPEESWVLDAPESTTPGGKNSFVLDHHRDNLVEMVEEAKSPMDRLGLRRRIRPRKSTSSHKGSGDYWKRPVPTGPNGSLRSYRISFAELQRMHLRKLQCKLVQHVADMRFRNKEPRNWEKDLQAYTKALQDYDYMFQHNQRMRDNFLVTGERYIDDYVLQQMLGADARQDAKLAKSKPIPVVGPWEDKSVPIGGTRSEYRTKSELAQLRDKIIMALLGGVFLVGPMWLMVLRRNLYTSLVTTTMCVAVFGLVMAKLLHRPMEVLSGTAAYAAVLVVFVGLNDPDKPAGR